MLDLIKRNLKKTYPKTPDISRDGQAVTIQFSDFMVDVVPGFNRQGGGYLIPNSISNTWISTNPKIHTDLIKNSNTIHNGDFVPLIKMIKSWNRNSGEYFNSFHLEALALKILEGVTITDYPSGVRYFFDKSRDWMNKQLPDPSGYEGDIGLYINTTEKIQEAYNKLQLAYERALKAESYASSGQIKNAIDMWIKIFGDYFPIYG